MPATLHILVVDDSPSDASLVAQALCGSNRAVDFARVDDDASMRDALDRRHWDVVLCDWSLRRFGALAALALLGETGLDLPCIIVTSAIREELVVEAMRAGARDYVLKGNLARLAPAVERELHDVQARRAHSGRSDSERQLLRAQKMEIVGGLAAGIAHDFNNVLSVVINEAEILARDPGLPRGLCADVEVIRTASQQAARLIRQLLSFCRTQVPEPRVLSLNHIIVRISEMLRHLLGADVHVTALPALALDCIEADSGQMEQIVMNLALNARDAMPDGGHLTIGTANVILDDEYAAAHHGVTAGAHVMLSVSDTGLGMSPETQSRIFEPFFTTKDETGGTGLGLSTVLGIVQQSRGHICVYSQPGRGTRFEIYFPAVSDPVGPSRSGR